MVFRELFYPSLGKVRSYAIDEKTAHHAAKFCDNWRGSDRVGETHSSFGRYYRWPAFLVTLKTYRWKKRILLTTEPLKKEFVLEQKCPIGLVLQDNIAISCPNVDVLNSLEILHHRACAASQSNIQLASRHAYWWSMPTFEMEYFNLLW